MIVEDQRELAGRLPERQQRPVIQRRATVHEQQRVSLPDDVDEQGHVPDLQQARPLRERPPSDTTSTALLRSDLGSFGDVGSLSEE